MEIQLLRMLRGMEKQRREDVQGEVWAPKPEVVDIPDAVATRCRSRLGDVFGFL